MLLIPRSFFAYPCRGHSATSSVKCMVKALLKTIIFQPTGWRMKSWGPRPIKVGGRIFYDYDECLAMARGEKPVKPAVAA